MARAVRPLWVDDILGVFVGEWERALEGKGRELKLYA